MLVGNSIVTRTAVALATLQDKSIQLLNSNVQQVRHCNISKPPLQRQIVGPFFDSERNSVKIVAHDEIDVVERKTTALAHTRSVDCYVVTERFRATNFFGYGLFSVRSPHAHA